MRALLRRDWLLLGLILLVAATLRFLTITHSSVWHDEGFTAFFVDRSPGEILDATARDVHPPLYYLLLHYWTEVLGRGEVALRGMSAFFGLLTIPLIYGIGRRLISREAGILAAFFAALAPFLVRFSQEARMYALVAFFTTLATYALVRALESRTGKSFDSAQDIRLQKAGGHERPATRRGVEWGWWGLYALAIAASAYTQYYGVLVVVAHGIYVAARLLWPEQKALLRERFGEPVRWLTGGLLALLLFLPWVPMLLAQVARVSDQYWIQKSWMTVHTVPSSIYQFVAYDHLDRLRGYWHEAPLLLLAALIGFCFWRFRSRWREIVLFLSLFLVPPLIMWGYSELRTPVYLDRYFPFAAVGLYLFLALGALAFRNRWVRAILVALMAGVMLFGNWLVYNSGNHQMREAAQAFAGQYRPGDAVVSADLYTFFDFSYYNRTGEPAKLLDRGSLTYGEPGLLKGREHLRVRSLSEISAPNGRVWAVGKPGERAYWREVPPEWRLEETIRRGSVEIRLYRAP